MKYDGSIYKEEQSLIVSIVCLEGYTTIDKSNSDTFLYIKIESNNNNYIYC